MSIFKKMKKEWNRIPKSQTSSSALGINVYKESDYYKTYLLKINENFGIGITVFKEDKDATLITSDEGTKVVFIAVDTTASMGGVIMNVSKQISTILKLSSTLLPVKIILALYADYEMNMSDEILIRNIHFIHVCCQEQANKALLDFWNCHVVAAGGGDVPEMNLTLMATIIQYYRGIIETEYDKHGFQVVGTDITCPVVTGGVNCTIIQISDAENRDPVVADPDMYSSLESRLEAACLQKVFPSFSKWHDIDGWCRENNVPYIRIHMGHIHMIALNRKAFQLGPNCSLFFASTKNQADIRLGSFIIALMTCILDMTSLEVITEYKEDFLIPLLEDQHQYQQDYVTEYGSGQNKLEALSLMAVEEIWRKNIGHVPEYSRGKVMIETLAMEETKKEYYFYLCMELARSDYFSVMTSNPVFAEVITAFKTVWSHKQVQEFDNTMSERLNICSKEERESYKSWQESGKTLAVSVSALINQLVFTPMEEEAQCEVVRLGDESARDNKDALVSDFNMQHPKFVAALYKFIKGLNVEKTTKHALKSELLQYTPNKEGNTITFAPVIDLSTLPDEIITEAEDENNETCNLEALELRGILSLYNSKLFLKDFSLISFAMMCIISSRQGECSQHVGHMGEKYLASLKKKRVNWLKDEYNPGKIKPEACGALYSMVIRPFWELHADKVNVRDNLLTKNCWKYMNIMAVMHLGVYNNVKLPVLEVKKTLECHQFTVLPSVLLVSENVRDRHFVVCKVCGSYTFRGATFMDVCVLCKYNEHLVFKCTNTRKVVSDSKKLASSNCVYESNVRRDFNGEMCCKKNCLPENGAVVEDLKKQRVSFLVCGKCSHTYAISGEKDLKRKAVCFVCTFIDTLKKKFKNGQDLKCFLGDMSNPTDMVIQMGIVALCEEGSSHLADKDTCWMWMNKTMEARQTSPLNAESVDRMKNTLKKFCGMQIVAEKKEQKKIYQQDVTQYPQREGDVAMRISKREKKLSRAKKRKEYKAHLKTLPYNEWIVHIKKRQKNREKKRESIAAMKKQQKEVLQSSNYEDLLRKVRDTFTHTCPKCKMSMVCSSESMWEGCLVCDGVVDPVTSNFFQQVQKPLSEVVPLDVLNTLVLTQVGVKLTGESWKDLKNVSSISQFFKFIEILPLEDGIEKMQLDDEADDEQRKLEKVTFCGKPFNHSLIYNHCLVLKKALEGKDLTFKEINEMKGVCLVCGDHAHYMYSLHKEGNCSGMICRLCATRYYWSVIKEASSSSTKKLSGWLSCMFCRQFCDNMHNIWIWIGVKHNIVNAIEDITSEESTYFRGVLYALSEGRFRKLSQEFEGSPDTIYNICHKCLQLKPVPENQLALPVPCGAPEPMGDFAIKFECDDCSTSLTTEVYPDVYPDNTIEAALFKLQRTNSTNSGPESVSSQDIVRQCPVCKHDIVKSEGCMAMHCPVQNCRATFCFICGCECNDTYTHLREVHHVSYFGDIDEEDYPFLTLKCVSTASGSQYLYVFDTNEYYFDTEDLVLTMC
ncbi:hypothetical protein Pmani_011557 [Petrolisthes manimaculis]|uniref:RBR-type E3 ubiquitin transferase n=1 Tax=Petrolisthes manimaculis TaxID=1843537 RepID=A0AAE1PZD2_9EUCA|nr:hypothetical protein Pmani_011557 [Petrolisthes manimaculis]